MKKLIIVRHGNYDGRLQLSEFGKQQMKSLADQLKSMINGDRAAILASTADRARQSAEVIGRELGVVPQLHQTLWSEARVKYSVQEVLDLVQVNQEPDVLILVTHMEIAELLPRSFGTRVLGVDSFDGHGIEKGDAWVIDCITRQMKGLCSF